MQKFALILHGWPQSDLSDHPLCLHLRKRGYEVIAIDLFDPGFVISPENVVAKVGELLGNRKIDVVFGISLGGLLLPYVASRYPLAKLVFIASGPFLRPNVALFKSMIELLQKKKFYAIARLILRLPSCLIQFVYRIFNPPPKEDQEKADYLIDMMKNVRVIKEIPDQKEMEIVQFISKVDNSEILKTLKNKTLIINGKHDLIMPQEAGNLLHNYLVNSRLIITDGYHFNVFSDENLKDIDQFL